MKRIFSHVGKYKFQAILAPLFKMLEATFELFVPLVVARIIDVGIASSDKVYVVRMVLLLVLLAAVGLAVSLSAQFFSARVAVNSSSDLRRSLFSHMQTFSYTELDRVGKSTLATRMTNDVNQVQNGINLTLRLLLRSPFVVFGAMIMAFTVDVNAALVFTVTIPVLSIIVFFVILATLPLYKKVQEKIDRIFHKTNENLAGVRVIRAFSRERGEEKEFLRENRELSSLQKFVAKLSSLLNPMTLVCVNIAIIFLLWTGALKVDSGELSQGEVIALYNYMSQILVELVKLANLIITVTKAIACAKRIDKVFEISSTDKGGDTPLDFDSEYAIEFDSATMKYSDSAMPAIDGVSLKIKRGETIGIIGGTGSGKSTLVSLIPALYPTSSGDVRVFGTSVKNTDLEKLRAVIGIVPQYPSLFSGTLRDNVQYGNADASDAQISEALKIAQAEDILIGKGLDHTIEQGGKNLSGGQRQRVTIARAVVREPKILILDDSASALDFATDARLRRSIAESTEDMTVIIVSQRTSAVASADRIAVLSQGKLVGWDTHEGLLENCEVYREIYSSQFKKEESV